MEIHQRRIGFRLNSVRILLGLSLFELSRLLGRSHYTLSAIERCIRYPTDDLIEAMIVLAEKYDITVSYEWLIGKETAAMPTSTKRILQEKIDIENHIESCLIHSDDGDYREKFGHRLAMLLKNMALTPLQFAKWVEASVDTVYKWLEGASLPKRNTMRFMISKMKREHIPLSLAWLCTGRGVLEPFQYVVPPKTNSLGDDQKDDGTIRMTIDSFLFDPTISKGVKIVAYGYPSNLFLSNWGGFYLYCHEGEWMPVQLESTTQLDVFHIMSLHNKLADRILLKNVTCAMIYPIIYSEKTYPVKITKEPYSLVTA